MRIDGVQAASLLGPSELRPVTSPTAATGGTATNATTRPFGEVLGNELNRVNDVMAEADHQAQRVATGDSENLHEAMLAMTEADLALQVTMHVTQKAIAAYQEISRMQL
jgi:flagellar hook-basal body complex protein FliE